MTGDRLTYSARLLNSRLGLPLLVNEIQLGAHDQNGCLCGPQELLHVEPHGRAGGGCASGCIGGESAPWW